MNVDGVFLTKPVDELYHTHELLTIPFMTGVNSDEGGWSISSVSLNATEICVTDKLTDEPLETWFCAAMVHV